MIDLLQDGLHRCGPDERLGLGIVGRDEVVDGFDQLGDAAEGATAESFPGQFAEPALDQVEPRAGCRREVKVEALMGQEPLSDLRMTMSAVVVKDKMEVDRLGELPVQPAQEAQELLMPVARRAGAEHSALSDIERGEQAGGTVPLVVVSHRLAAS